MDTPDDHNFQQALLASVAKFLQPLKDAALDDPPGVKLLAELGWNCNAIDGFPLAKLAAALQAIVDLIEDIAAWVDQPPKAFGDLQRALADVDSVIKAVKGLASLFDGTGKAAPPQFDALAVDLLDHLTLTFLKGGGGIPYAVLALLGVVRPSDSSGGRAAVLGQDGQVVSVPFSPDVLDWSRFGKLLTDPVATLKSDFIANPLATSANAQAFADRLYPVLSALVASLGLRTYHGRAPSDPDYGAAGNALLDRTITFAWDQADGSLGTHLTLLPADLDGPGVAITPFGSLTEEWASESWHVAISADAAVQAFSVGPQGVVFSDADSAAQFSVALNVARVSAPGKGSWLIGSTSGTRLEIKGLLLALQGDFSATRQDFGFLMGVDKAKLVIQAGDGDGFISSVMPKQAFELDFDLGIGWSSTKGLYFKGGAAIEVSIPVHETILNVVTLESVDLSIKPDAGAVNLAVALTGGLQLGPLSASVKKLGLSTAITFPPDGGNLGPLQVGQFGFKLPEGIGLVIDTAAVRGGGGLQIHPDMYSGELQLCINQVIDLTAIGIINTKLPGGAAGFALLLLITAKFQPIQLGYGFTLNGVGGLAAFNHSMDQQALSDGVRNHSLDSILFPTNPVANANKIISDLQRVFPVTPGRFVFAPMVEIGWGGSVLLIDVALVLDLPSPLRLSILGRMHLLLPPATAGATGDAAKVVVINLDVQGSLDLDQDAISVDAFLYDSRLALFPITGGMAMRIRWGAQPQFLFALGGFNPRFTPPPGFPPLDRVGIQMRYDKDGVRAGLCLTSYFAVTTNTLQFGARIDAYAEVSIAKLAGYLGFDALVDMVPFHVILDLYGGVSVEAFGFKFACDLLLTLAAFDPVTGDGHVTIDFCGKHEAPIHFSIGDAKPLPALPVADALHELMNALGDVANWSAGAQAGAGMVVNLRPPTAAEVTASAGKPLAHPLARLSVRQRVLPFKVALQRFGAATPAQPGPFDIASLTLGSAAAAAPAATAALRDDFARGQFLVLSDDDKLCAPQFESFVCGYDGLGTEGARIATPQVAEFSYDTRVIDDRAQPAKALPAVVVSFDYMRRVGQVGAPPVTAAARYAAPPKGIKVSTPKWKSVATDRVDATAPDTFDSYTQAQAHRRSQPGAGKRQVVESFELA